MQIWALSFKVLIFCLKQTKLQGLDEFDNLRIRVSIRRQDNRVPVHCRNRGCLLKEKKPFNFGQGFQGGTACVYASVIQWTLECWNESLFELGSVHLFSLVNLAALEQPTVQTGTDVASSSGVVICFTSTRLNAWKYQTQSDLKKEEEMHGNELNVWKKKCFGESIFSSFALPRSDWQPCTVQEHCSGQKLLSDLQDKLAPIVDRVEKDKSVAAVGSLGRCAHLLQLIPVTLGNKTITTTNWALLDRNRRTAG